MHDCTKSELVVDDGVESGRKKKVPENCNVGLGDCGPIEGDSGGFMNCGTGGLKLES